MRSSTTDDLASLFGCSQDSGERLQHRAGPQGSTGDQRSEKSTRLAGWSLARSWRTSWLSEAPGDIGGLRGATASERNLGQREGSPIRSQVEPHADLPVGPLVVFGNLHLVNTHSCI